MLVKEYRILLPLTVDEYRIAQLYMIQKKSRVDTSGAGSGVEIIKNDPYEDGPGGTGQYTYKVYHIGSHLPAWFRSILPKSALRVEEEAWNAYPYTKTRFTCPFVERFSLEIITVYYNDPGTRENVFDLNQSELNERIVDYMDFVKDPISVMDYCVEEDPTLYKSKRTSRGPLDDDWVKKCQENNTPVMCAYKLCRVEFRYWGMQTRIEKFIHDAALRKTMLRAHRQAWAWQDEWYGLTIEDIRRLEKEAQEHLNKKMQAALKAEGQEAVSSSPTPGSPVSNRTETPSKKIKASPAGSLWSQESGAVRRDHLEAIRTDSDESDSEFFDASDSIDSTGLKEFIAHRPHVVRWSSVEMLAIEEEGGSGESTPATPSLYNPEDQTPRAGFSDDNLPMGTSTIATGKQTDLQTFSGTLDLVIRTHYPQLWGRVALRLVSCPCIVAEAINLLASDQFTSEYSVASSSLDGCCHPALIPLLAADSHSYEDHLHHTVHKANQVVGDFLTSEEGQGFSGEVCILGDALGGLLAYDLLTKQRMSSLSRNPSQISARSDLTDISVVPIPEDEQQELHSSTFRSESEDPESPAGTISNGHVAQGPHAAQRLSMPDEPGSGNAGPVVVNGPGSLPHHSHHHLSAKTAAHRHRVLSAPESSTGSSPVRGRSMSSEAVDGIATHHHRHKKPRLDFRVSTLFLVGSPIGLVLAHRRIVRGPVGLDGTDLSNLWMTSHVWFGLDRRVDFALYCPEGLATLPKAALPNLLHASFWENSDVAAFIMRQFVTGDDFTTGSGDRGEQVMRFGSSLSVNPPLFSPAGPTEKWVRKRTSFKIKNATANHRANDIIVTEFQPQVLHARFIGEKVDIYIKTETEPSSTGPGGDWVKFGTESTDNHGRLTYSLPAERPLPLGLYPVKMVVRGDHTYLDMFLAVVPPQTECVVFSIDGSFTASVSVTGKDPKVRPGAVDVVRHWQDLGYLILYITARPDMQQKRVISWLAQHNFPHGLLFFTDGISTDPLKQKTQYLKQLVDQRQVKFQAGYGSSKDIHVYSAAGVLPGNIFVIGKVSKKLQTQSQVLTEGYSVHLSQLTTGTLQSVGRPAQGNGRLLIRKGCFSLPGQYRSVTVQRSQSFTPRTGKYLYDTQQSASTIGGPMGGVSLQPELLRGVSVFSGVANKKRGISPFRMISRGSAKGKDKEKEKE